MRCCRLVWLAGLLLVWVVTCGGTVCAAEPKHPVLMISIDGMRPDTVTKADAHGLHVPNLRRFITEGSYAEGVIGVVPTLTYPSHTTLVTGVTPSVHGITSNTTFDPLFKNQVGWYWYADMQHAQTLWEAAHKKGIVTANLNWPVTVDAPGIDVNMPEYWRASTPDDLYLLRALARPLGLQQQLEASEGTYVDGNTTTVASDAVRTKYGVAMLRRFHPGFFTIHLSSLDETEHETAPFSAASNSNIEAIDGMIGALRDAALAVNPNTVVTIVSDHGFVRTDHRVNFYGYLLRAGLMTIGGTSPLGTPVFTSWKATLWPAGGVAAVMLHDPKDAASLDEIMKILNGLAADPANGILRIVPAAELHAMGGFPDAQALVVLKDDYQLGYAFSGPLVTPAPSTGMHGYLPSNPEMRSSFFAMGRGIAHGRDLGVVDMRQIAPTIADLLGTHLAGKVPAGLKVQ
jgi:predicted AlkP superfamily pyrophosphatase or phosphodiesterase